MHIELPKALHNWREVARVHGSASLEHPRARLKCRRCRMKAARVVVLPPV